MDIYYDFQRIWEYGNNNQQRVQADKPMSQNLLNAPRRRAGFAPFNGLQLNSMFYGRCARGINTQFGRRYYGDTSVK